MDAKTSFLDEVHAGRFLMDGAMGSTLLATGRVAAQQIALASLQHPELVSCVHRNFLEAGSRCLQSNTFGANSMALRACGAEANVKDLNARAVELAQGAAHEHADVFVAGNLGPASLWGSEDSAPTASELEQCYGEQGEALLAAGVDLFSLETMGASAEACRAITVLRSLGDLPILASMTFVRASRGFATLAGEPIEPVLIAMQAAGADLVGVNCGEGSREALELIRNLSCDSQLALVVQPNSGGSMQAENSSAPPATPAEFAEDLLQLLEAGVLAVGGCCGTDERFIAALAREL